MAATSSPIWADGLPPTVPTRINSFATASRLFRTTSGTTPEKFQLFQREVGARAGDDEDENFRVLIDTDPQNGRE